MDPDITSASIRDNATSIAWKAVMEDFSSVHAAKKKQCDFSLRHTASHPKASCAGDFWLWELKDNLWGWKTIFDVCIQLLNYFRREMQKLKKKKRAVVCETSRIRPGFQSALAVLLTYGRAAITFIHFVHLLVGINERY